MCLHWPTPGRWSRYANQIPEEKLHGIVENALTCANNLMSPRNDRRIYVTSDTRISREIALKMAGEKIVATSLDEPLHLDRGKNYLSRRQKGWTVHNATEYFPVFSDLYILSKSRCVTYDRGGFGMLGAILSGHLACSHPHQRACRKHKDSSTTPAI